jgi:Uma2 family endonuclease
MVLREQTYTAEEFWQIAQLPENETLRLELEDGVIVEMASSSPRNTVIAARMAYFLNTFVLPRNLGYVTAPDGGFKLGKGRVRQPDCAFISKKRLPTLPKEFDIAPDIAVEVVSQNEDVLRKAKEYLEAGTQLVWVIYPDEQSVEVLRPHEPRWQTLGVEDTLSGESVLTGFELPVRDIFPSQDESV